MEKEPLVSIVVITYNSSKYVLETLESIKLQTYLNIELIISDDCSTDNTVEICREFLDKNQEIPFLKSAKIVSTAKNSGITPNYNNGLKYASGEWIKYIAGDDLLTEDCVESFVEATKRTADKLFVCGTYPFNEKEKFPPRYPYPERLKGNVKLQMKALIKYGTFIEGPTIFVHRKTLLEFGGFSEDYPFIEDFPLFFKFLTNGHRIHVVDKPLVKYREYQTSVSRSGSLFVESMSKHYRAVVAPLVPQLNMYLFHYHNCLMFFMEDNRKKFFWKNRIVRYLIKCIDPISWSDFYHKKVNKSDICRP